MRRTKTSATPLLSPAIRFVASEVNATSVPLAASEGSVLSPSDFKVGNRNGDTTRGRLTSVFVAAIVSYRNTSSTASPSDDEKFVAADVKATLVPSADSDGSKLSALPTTPAVEIEPLDTLASRLP